MSFSEHPLAWCIIPARNLERAVAFYSKVFDVELEILDLGKIRIAPFSMSDKHAGGALMYDSERAGNHGVLVYLNGAPDLSACLERVETARGMVTLPKTEIIQGLGYYAHFMDSEGNEIGLWSPK